AHELGDAGRLIVQAPELDMSDFPLGEEQHAAEWTDDIHRYGHGRWSEQHAGPPQKRYCDLERRSDGWLSYRPVRSSMAPSTYRVRTAKSTFSLILGLTSGL